MLDSSQQIVPVHPIGARYGGDPAGQFGIGSAYGQHCSIAWFVVPSMSQSFDKQKLEGGQLKVSQRRHPQPQAAPSPAKVFVAQS